MSIAILSKMPDALKVNQSQSAPSIILYDGVCGFCNQTVQFIIKRDAGRRFRFAALQSKIAERLLQNHPEIPRNLDSLVLLHGETAYTQSDAVLRIGAALGMPWRFAGLFLLLPRGVRNGLYRAF